MNQEHPAAEFLDRLEGVRHEQQRLAALLKIANARQALGLESDIADSQNFVNQQDVGINLHGHGEPEPDIHAAGIVLDGHVQKFPDTGEFHNPVKSLQDRCPGIPRIARSEKCSRVRSVRVETCSQFQEGETDPEFDRAGRRGGGPGQQPQQELLPDPFGPITPMVSPGATVKLTSCSAWMTRRRGASPRASIPASVGGSPPCIQ